MAEIPVRPVGRKDIHVLETILLVGTLFRKDVLEEIKSAEERLTWVDSLAVAAGALAREKAGMPVSTIAEELGRTEATIRNHLTGKTKAGQLVRETYEKLVREGFKIEVPLAEGAAVVSEEEYNRLKEEVERLKSENSRLREKIEKAIEVLRG